MVVILQRFSTEISSSGLGRRPLTAETRVRVPVSLPNKAPGNSRGFLLCYHVLKGLSVDEVLDKLMHLVDGGVEIIIDDRIVKLRPDGDLKFGFVHAGLDILHAVGAALD